MKLQLQTFNRVISLSQFNHIFYLISLVTKNSTLRSLLKSHQKVRAANPGYSLQLKNFLKIRFSGALKAGTSPFQFRQEVMLYGFRYLYAASRNLYKQQWLLTWTSSLTNFSLDLCCLHRRLTPARRQLEDQTQIPLNGNEIPDPLIRL